MLKGVTRLTRLIFTPSLRVVKPPLKNLYPLWSVGNYATSKIRGNKFVGGKIAPRVRGGDKISGWFIFPRWWNFVFESKECEMNEESDENSIEICQMVF